jgi:hypothetical protein
MNMRASITLNHGGIDGGEFKKVLTSVPDNAKVTIRTHQADRFGTDWHTVEFSWET